MNDGTRIHTAARTFCVTQRSDWMEKYVKLSPTVENYLSGWTYSREQCNIFPRYRLAEATLINLERLVPDADTCLEDALEVALEAGEMAYSALSAELASLENGSVALVALREQLDSYSSFLSHVAEQPTIRIEPLAYRRVLSDRESDELWKMLSEQWQIRGPGYGWFPINDDPAPKGALTFHEELWNARDGGKVLESFLAAEHIERCFLLRELGPPNYEFDSVLVDPHYDGSEKFLFAGCAWVLYSSHESSLTLVGRLATFFREAWHDADQLSYGGPFHTSDLRGKWS